MKKLSLTLSTIFSFLLNIVPVNAASIFDAEVFSRIYDLLIIVFRVTDASTDTLILFTRISLFVLSTTFVYVILDKYWTEKSYNDSSSRGPIIIALIIGWSTSILLPTGTLLYVYGTYASILIALVYLLPAGVLLYFYFNMLPKWIPDGTLFSVITKLFLFLFLLILLGSMNTGFETLSSGASSEVRDAAETFAFVNMWAILLVSLVFGFQIIHLIILLLFKLGEADLQIRQASFDVINGYKDLLRQNAGATHLAEDAEEPVLKQTAQETANILSDKEIDELGDLIQKVKEESTHENIEKVEESIQTLNQAELELEESKNSVKKVAQELIEREVLEDVNKKINKEVSEAATDIFDELEKLNKEAVKISDELLAKYYYQMIGDITQLKTMKAMKTGATEEKINLFNNILGIMRSYQQRANSIKNINLTERSRKIIIIIEQEILLLTETIQKAQAKVAKVQTDLNVALEQREGKLFNVPGIQNKLPNLVRNLLPGAKRSDANLSLTLLNLINKKQNKIRETKEKLLLTVDAGKEKIEKEIGQLNPEIEHLIEYLLKYVKEIGEIAAAKNTTKDQLYAQLLQFGITVRMNMESIKRVNVLLDEFKINRPKFLDEYYSGFKKLLELIQSVMVKLKNPNAGTYSSSSAIAEINNAVRKFIPTMRTGVRWVVGTLEKLKIKEN